MTNTEHSNLKDIVAFTKGDLTIPYSNITEFSGNSVCISGEWVDSISDSVISAMKDGKLEYEAYKLANAKDNIDAYVDDLIANKISAKFEEAILSTNQLAHAYLERFNNCLTNIHLKAESDIAAIASDIQATSKDVHSVSKELSSILTKVQKEVSKLSLDTLSSDIKDRVASLDKVQQEYTTVTDRLRELLKE